MDMKTWILLGALLAGGTLGRQHSFISDQCGSHPAPSCSLSINITSPDSCCMETNAGLFVLSQFWDVYAGFEDRWTIHGLWNNFCNYTFCNDCDDKRAYTNITSILISRHAYKLLQDMNNNWPNPAGHVDEFWSHEWNKHGVCMSTFAPRCYTGQDVFQGMIDFYNTTINLSHKYDIYKALERHGIVPGDSYTTALVQKVIEKEFGMIPDFRCNDKGQLEETWIYFHMKGPVKRMDLVPAHNANATNCNKTLVYPTKYPNDDLLDREV